MKEKIRCEWAGKEPLNISYHDKEWGVPQFDDQLLFEFLILEGMQAGLSWLTVLKKRNHFREVFDHFDPVRIKNYKQHKIEKLLQDPGIIRHPLKIQAAVINANAFLNIKNEFNSFSEYLWNFVEHKPIQNHWKKLREVPTNTVISDQLSKDLKKRGFKFVGSTICYAFMQAIGMVNDHTVDCFRYYEILNG